MLETPMLAVISTVFKQRRDAIQTRQPGGSNISESHRLKYLSIETWAERLNKLRADILSEKNHPFEAGEDLIKNFVTSHRLHSMSEAGAK